MSPLWFEFRRHHLLSIQPVFLSFPFFFGRTTPLSGITSRRMGGLQAGSFRLEPPPRRRAGPTSPRRRALTIPSQYGIDSDVAQTTIIQSESALITNLPREIREMIYHLALGGCNIHFFKKSQQDARLRSCFCQAKHALYHDMFYDSQRTLKCGGEIKKTVSDSDGTTGRKDIGHRPLFALLLTCRQMCVRILLS